jgi:hypothetical protein
MTNPTYPATKSGSKHPHRVPWHQRIAIRSPRLAVLQLHLVVTWAVMSSAVAWLGAPMVLGTTQHFVEPTVYAHAWYLISSGTSLLWCYRQWRLRSSLPRHEPLGGWWSPGTAALIVILMHSSVAISRVAADKYISSQRERAAVLQDSGHLDCFYDGTKFTRAMIGMTIVLPSSSAPADDDIYTECRSLLNVYAPAEALESIKDCINEVPVARACALQYDVDCGPAFEACDIAQATSLAGHNYNILARAYRMVTSQDDMKLASLVSWMIVEGFFASCAGVTSFITAGLSLVTLWIFVTAISGFRDLIEALLSLTGSQVFDGWSSMGWIAYAIFLIAILVTLSVRAVRDRWRDVGVLLALFGPLFVLYVHRALFAGSTELDAALRHHSYMCGVALVIGFLSTPLLSYYRRLPWST